MKLYACFYAVLLVFTASALAAAPPPNAAFITMQGPAITIGAVHDVVESVAEAGGHVYHVMPVHLPGPARDLSGCCLIASIPPGQEPPLLAMPCVMGMHRGPVDCAMFAPMGQEAVCAAGAWNYLFDEVIEPPPVGVDPIPNDALISPEGGENAGSGAKAAMGPMPLGAPTQSQTSEFMIGSIAIGVVMPESNGAGENWGNGDPAYPGQNRQQMVYNKIVAGANWWGVTGGAAANLTFFYDQRFGIATQYEPITISSANNGEYLWVGDTLATMGYTTGNADARARAYDNAIRTANGTNWAYSVFVADSLNDADGMFPNGTIAFSYLYGPFMVMTYDNDGWGLARMNQVFAHESGHTFGAPDEYAGAWSCTCTNYGYLSVTNGNCVNCVGTQAPCVMSNNVLSLCNYTPGHVGWRDTDGDGILDPVDGGLAFTSAYLDYGPTPPFSTNPQITGHGTAQATPWPSTSRTPVSINKVTAVTYSVDGGLLIMTTPRDGAFNSDIESFDFTSAAQISGPHMVMMMAIDNWGSAAGSPLNITIDTTPPPMPPPMAMIMEAPYSANPTMATVNWAPAPPDPESGIAGHQVTLRQASPPLVLASFYVPMPQPMWPFGGLAMLHGKAYYATVAGVNGAGLTGPAAASPTLTIDMTPPGAPSAVQDSGAGTDLFDHLAFSWTAPFEDVSPISDYFLDIRDDLSSPVWSGWTGSSSTSYTAMGLPLILGRKYTGMVSARNAAGMPGPLSPPSDGIMAVMFFPNIGQIKTMAGPGMPVGVRGVYATSSGAGQPGAVYAQHLNRTTGIRTDSTDSITLGDKIEIAGLIQHSPTGELQLWNSEVAAEGGSATVSPLGMSNKALGGGILGLQQGVINGSGANNIGLLVQVWGQVTNVTPGPAGYFTVDDGGGVMDQFGFAGVGVRCGSVTPPTYGAFVKVRGVCSYELGYPVVLIRQTGDWW